MVTPFSAMFGGAYLRRVPDVVERNRLTGGVRSCPAWPDIDAVCSGQGRRRPHVRARRDHGPPIETGCLPSAWLGACTCRSPPPACLAACSKSSAPASPPWAPVRRDAVKATIEHLQAKDPQVDSLPAVLDGALLSLVAKRRLLSDVALMRPVVVSSVMLG